MPQPGFFDLDERHSKLDGLGDPLTKIVGRNHPLPPRSVKANRKSPGRAHGLNMSSATRRAWAAGWSGQSVWTGRVARSE